MNSFTESIRKLFGIVLLHVIPREHRHGNDRQLDAAHGRNSLCTGCAGTGSFPQAGFQGSGKRIDELTWQNPALNGAMR